MSYCATQSDIYLHHLAIASPDPDALSAFYSKVMDMSAIRSDESGYHCVGPDRRLILSKGNAKDLVYAGFACRNAEGLALLRTHAETQDVKIDISPSPYFGEEAFCVTDPDGNRICFGLAQSQDMPIGIQGPIQHLTFASFDVEAFQKFYHKKLGFEVSDRVLHSNGTLATCFTTANHEHHTIACFKSNRQGMDHHSYEAGEWNYIRDWCDHFADHDVQLMWGPGRHGPGNNLFIFIEDPDGNWIEVSAELEIVKGRTTKDWPQAERTLNKWGQAIMRS